jgi:hypothetical protein
LGSELVMAWLFGGGAVRWGVVVEAIPSCMATIWLFIGFGIMVDPTGLSSLATVRRR